MKKILLFAWLPFFAACNSKDSAKSESNTTASEMAAKKIQSPYEILYSSQFTMDDPQNAETVLQLWKDWDNGNLSAHKDKIADSMQIYFSDGSVLHNSRDSLLASVQSYRDIYSASASQVDAVMAVKSTDKNENWVLIWGMEKNTDKNGKTDSSHIQETWRFNKDGKADLMYQFRAAITPPKK